MPIGIIANGMAIIIGGLIGTVAGHKIFTASENIPGLRDVWSMRNGNRNFLHYENGDPAGIYFIPGTGVDYWRTVRFGKPDSKRSPYNPKANVENPVFRKAGRSGSFYGRVYQYPGTVLCQRNGTFWSDAGWNCQEKSQHSADKNRFWIFVLLQFLRRI